jgi:hypothetical protein
MPHWSAVSWLSLRLRKRIVAGQTWALEMAGYRLNVNAYRVLTDQRHRRHLN